MNAIYFIMFVAGLMTYLRFGHPYVCDLLDNPTGSVQPWNGLEELIDDEFEMYVQVRKLADKPVTIDSEELDVLPTDPLALAILKVTLTEEQIKAIRVTPIGALPGEVLEDLPAEIEDVVLVEATCPVQEEFAFTEHR